MSLLYDQFDWSQLLRGKFDCFLAQLTHYREKNKMKNYFSTLSTAHQAAIEGHLRLFDLNPKKHFCGSLNVGKGKKYTLKANTKDNGYHKAVTPHSIQHAKTAIGTQNHIFKGKAATRPYQPLNVVDARKTRKKLTAEEITSLHTAAHAYIWGDSSMLSHWEAPLNKFLVNSLKANVHVYTVLDLHSILELDGDAQSPVVLIAHTINVHPGGGIAVKNKAPVTMYVTEWNYISKKSANKAKADTTDYDVEIIVNRQTDAANGTDGQNGTDQTKKAPNGSKGESGCCTDKKPGAGSTGYAGHPGQPGTPGSFGSSCSGGQTYYVATLDCSVNVVAQGDNGGNGGVGGNGGKGGEGGNGGTGNGTGAGGAGGTGGSGGNGADGGQGGDGGVIYLCSENIQVKLFNAQIDPGHGGTGGKGGTGGEGGDGGTGDPHGAGGESGAPGTSGNPGLSGQIGAVHIEKAQPPTIDSFSPNTGPAAGGTGVTISGTNFFTDAQGQSLMEFSINGQLLTNVVVVNSLTATGTMPANPAGQYPIQGYNTATKIACVSAQNFTYTTQ